MPSSPCKSGNQRSPRTRTLQWSLQVPATVRSRLLECVQPRRHICPQCKRLLFFQIGHGKRQQQGPRELLAVREGEQAVKRKRNGKMHAHSRHHLNQLPGKQVMPINVSLSQDGLHVECSAAVHALPALSHDLRHRQ